MITRKTPLGTIGLMMGGVPAVQTEFAWSLAQMVQFNQEHLCPPNTYIHLLKSAISYHATARNDMVRDMQGDWLLMLDSDHAFEPNLLMRMLRLFEGDDPKVDILTGLYTYRAWPHGPVLYKWKDDHFRHVGAFEDPTAPLAQVDAGGAGCLLVRKSVFDRIKTELKEAPFNIIPPYSEDNSFFIRCMKLGIPVYVAPKIQCHHLMTKRLSLSDFDTTYANMEKAS